MSQRRPGCKSNPQSPAFTGAQFCDEAPGLTLLLLSAGPDAGTQPRASLEREQPAVSRPFLPGCSLPGATCCFSSPPPLLLEREPEPEFGCCAGLSNAAPATGFSPVAGGGRLKVGSRQQLSLGRARVPLTRVSPPAPGSPAVPAHGSTAGRHNVAHTSFTGKQTAGWEICTEMKPC